MNRAYFGKKNRAPSVSAFTRLRLVAAVAAVAFPAAFASANAVGGTGQIFNVSTTGATALGNFTRGDAPGAPGTSIINLGVNSLTIGGTTYTLDDDGEQLGFQNKAAAGTRDSWAYYYHETGSIEGILELSDGYNLTAGINRRPFDATSGNPLYLNGNRFNATPILNSAGAAVTGPTLAINTGGANINSRNGWVIGRNFLNSGNTYPGSTASTSVANQIIAPGYDTPGKNTGTDGLTYFGQDLTKIAWSDVPTFQAFANPGASNPNARPLDDPITVGVEATAGYGKGRSQGNSNFQKLRDIDSISGGQANFKNETVAIAPFAVVASPGTGLAKVTDVDVKWLHAMGRLPNGANFNVVTRDPGSGTRNQGANNVGLDPSWSMGERDRIVASGTPSFIVADPDGNNVRILPGDEGRPLNTLTGGASSLLTTEDRPGPNAKFSDKTSGGSRLAPAVYRHRMAIGAHLSSGDVISRTDSYSSASGLNRQTRVLAIDWAEQPGEVVSGFVQPRAEDITEGRYQFWSLAQAVTVRASTDSASADFNTIRAHTPGAQHTQYTPAQEQVLVQQHRAFLDNIINSAASLPAVSNSTPGTGILQAGFIVPQIMGTTKAYDGATQVARIRSTTDPDGAGPILSEQALWTEWKNDPFLGGVLNWADSNNFENDVPGYNPDTTSLTQVQYDIYRRANTSTTPTGGTGDANADANIIITQRVALAGDFNNDQVRDLADVPAMARALANPDAYLADATLGGPAVAAAAQFDNRSGGLGVFSRVKANLNGGAAAEGAAVPAKFGLMVLSDFDGDGNINAADNAVAAIERDDVRYFLHGASIDTSAFATPKARREDGIRLGQLKKNQAIDTFNTTLQSFVGTLNDPATIAPYTQDAIDTLKFEKRDVDGSGSKGIGAAGDRNFLADAFIVDQFQGKRYTHFDDSINATVKRAFTLTAADAATFNNGNTTRWVEVGFNLVDAELNDSPDGLIDQTDLDVMNQALTTTAGVNPTGRVDHVWTDTSKTGSGHIAINASAGTITVPANGATLRIDGGRFSAGGTLDPFTDSITGQSVNVQNSGTLAITGGAKRLGAVTGNGHVELTAGSLDVKSLRSATLAVSTGVVKVLSKGANPPSVSRIESLPSVSAGGSLDLTDNNLVVGGSTPDAVRQLIAAGATVTRTWNGSGLVSSLANVDSRALGYASLAQLGGTAPADFAGETLVGTDVLVKPTFYGDANLDGGVDTADFNRFLAGFGGAGDWSRGDFNYDGGVDTADFNLFLGSFGQSAAPAQVAEVMSAFASATPVPEPTALGLLAIGAAGLLGRRKRR